MPDKKEPNDISVLENLRCENCKKKFKVKQISGMYLVCPHCHYLNAIDIEEDENGKRIIQVTRLEVMKKYAPREYAKHFADPEKDGTADA